jgi:nucleoside-triphosphatase
VDIKGRVALTGRPGVGKTTLIERVLADLPGSAGGMITREIRRCGYRIGFAVIDIATGVEGVLAHLHQPRGPKVGRYRVNLDDLESIGIGAIERSLDAGTLTVIDELAPMEITSPRFVPIVQRALDEEGPLLISTHANLQHALVHRVRRELDLVRVRLGNRDELVAVVGRLLRGENAAGA